MQDVQRSISLRELNWDDVDGFSRSHGFKDRSGFVEYCISKTIFKRRMQNIYAFLYILMLALMMVLLVIINLRIG